MPTPMLAVTGVTLDQLQKSVKVVSEEFAGDFESLLQKLAGGFLGSGAGIQDLEPGRIIPRSMCSQPNGWTLLGKKVDFACKSLLGGTCVEFAKTRAEKIDTPPSDINKDKEKDIDGNDADKDDNKDENTTNHISIPVALKDILINKRTSSASWKLLWASDSLPGGLSIEVSRCFGSL
ncbi:hypothetical protein KEM48_005308 [Puccinia striiformis f. sp. tritici PST-130]|uniref:Uncharacterized protein n=2 Tax=Puccinia striiformis TaxID=27350 RepID=A0A0L0UU44_9BASI|nr:hypothetical protein H4Q26_004643 [Puccinia striiformis f. sp. tritici PST-130]KAI9616216.1 hypothetical protein KEM48_005308 [Puccinia striiformis f. sp. tritici PST-130]KNE90545.1 hypothetical protein PSTG_16007 [Puccinia striiformis f. sp. tritici PST-78]POW06757.1 hypothetical protein PSTT_08729 [Puccinia striiformis]